LAECSLTSKPLAYKAIISASVTSIIELIFSPSLGGYVYLLILLVANLKKPSKAISFGFSATDIISETALGASPTAGAAEAFGSYFIDNFNFDFKLIFDFILF